MSKCCKSCKWWPHNWLCLKGLSVLFVVLFYVTLAYAVFQAYAVLTYPMLTGSAKWLGAGFYFLTYVLYAFGFLTVAKILQALRKIKKAVAPCGCSMAQAEEEPAESETEKVVEQESK